MDCPANGRRGRATKIGWSCIPFRNALYWQASFTRCANGRKRPFVWWNLTWNFCYLLGKKLVFDLHPNFSRSFNAKMLCSLQIKAKQLSGFVENNTSIIPVPLHPLFPVLVPVRVTVAGDVRELAVSWTKWDFQCCNVEGILMKY